jgi:hypothetical protein
LPQASGLPARILPTPTIVYQQLAPCPFGDGPGSGPYGAYFLEPKRPDTDMPSNWLDTDKFDGVSIKVRVSGSTRESWPWENGSYEKQLACTLGKRPGGIPREIQIRLMSKGARILIAPICFLIPVHPDGIKERGIIIVGDDMGKEVVVVEAGGPPWQVQTTAGKMLKVLREHIVVKSKLRLPS